MQELARIMRHAWLLHPNTDAVSIGGCHSQPLPMPEVLHSTVSAGLQAFVRKLSWAKSRPLSPAQRVMLKARGINTMCIDCTS